MNFFTLKYGYAVGCNLSCYLVTALILYLANEYVSAGIFNNFFNFSNALLERSLPTINRLHEKELALNFLCNIRNLSFKDKLAFESSGLIHLLAISGSQITPITNGLAYICGKLLYFSFKSKKQPLLLMQTIYQFKIIFSNLLSFTISSFFGWSGALIRVVAINYFMKMRILQIIYVSVFNIFPYLFYTTYSKCLTIFLFSLFFGNLTFSISFLLSFIGALSLSTINRITKYLNISNFYLYFINTILTTFFISLLLLPFSKTHIFYACLANILAVPIVCFFITPLTLIILIIPHDWEFTVYIIKIFDYFLVIFKNISILFTDNQIPLSSFNSNYKIFSTFGIIYLNIVFILLSLINDLCKENRIIITRLKFNSIKV